MDATRSPHRQALEADVLRQRADQRLQVFEGQQVGRHEVEAGAAFVRHGDVARVHSLRRGAAEALELIVHGDRDSSKVVGRRIEELPVIQGAHIGAILRKGPSRTVLKDGLPVTIAGGEVIIPHHDTVIEADDHVIVFCTRKAQIAQVEKLFQVGFGFF